VPAGEAAPLEQPSLEADGQEEHERQHKRGPHPACLPRPGQCAAAAGYGPSEHPGPAYPLNHPAPASETAADGQELTSADAPFRQAAGPATAAVLACTHLSLATSLGGTSIA